MSDFLLVLTIVAFFVVAALLVRVMDRMIAAESDESGPGDEAASADAAARDLEPGRRA